MSKARHARPRRTTRRVARTFAVAGLGAGLTAAASGAAFAAETYTVKSGDTLSEIAYERGLDWHELAKLNRLADPDLILVGQQLKLDGTASAAAAEPRRTTKPPTVKKKAERTEKKRTKRTTRSSERGGGSASMSAAWRKLVECESSGNPRAVNPAGYYGLFQFDLQTWRSVGGTGNPADASASEQYMRAKRLYAERGAQPWPVCGRFLR
jgi:hypothetical protein